MASDTPVEYPIFLLRCLHDSPKHRETLESLRSLYEESFPVEERREWSSVVERVEREPRYHFFFLQHQELGVVGFITLWRMSQCYYGEHFAIDPRYRNHHFGTHTLRALESRMGSTPLIIEVEPSTLSAMAERRIEFYHRNSFSIVKKDYLQPPYHEGDGYTPLYLMARGDLSSLGIEGACREIYRRVYGVE